MSNSPSVVELKASDLNPQGGVPCPNPKSGMQAWSSHPRVYLDIARTGEARCPYCGTRYRLQAGEAVAHGH
jgi:uncharacterized Zn-finger protein